ncbi:MAG: flagellar assembly protein FliH [Gammaproteobacteria bacterium]|nr:flagellar assembly protein FliH [Gammaproteobacteria bacterium]
MSTRLIRNDELPAGCRPWTAPEVVGPAAATLSADGREAGAVREAARQAGFEEGRRAGFEAGRQAGLEAAGQEIARRSQTLAGALDALASPFDGLEQRFHEEIIELVRAVCRQLVRREMQLDPSHIAGTVREALAVLPMTANDVVVRVHPQDAAVLQDCLAPAAGSRAWRIEADPLLERGGCIITSAGSQIDGRLETRLARTIATLFDDARSPEQTHGSPADEA